jgi:putative addiction module component (TIGR02574 family)
MSVKNNSGKRMKMAKAKALLEDALTLRPIEKAELIEKLLSSLDPSDEIIDTLWIKEAEDRIDAYEQGQIIKVSVEQVLRKYR